MLCRNAYIALGDYDLAIPDITAKHAGAPFPADLIDRSPCWADPVDDRRRAPSCALAHLARLAAG